MGKIEDLRIYGSIMETETNLKLCYDFLSCSPNDSISEVRANYIYLKLLIEDCLELVEGNVTADYYHELNDICRITNDIYLAILLSKLNRDDYNFIINKLCSFHLNGDVKNKLSILDNSINHKKSEKPVMGEDYIGYLTYKQKSGEEQYSPSIKNIIQLESENLRPTSRVKVYYNENYPLIESQI